MWRVDSRCGKQNGGDKGDGPGTPYLRPLGLRVRLWRLGREQMIVAMEFDVSGLSRLRHREIIDLNRLRNADRS